MGIALFFLLRVPAQVSTRCSNKHDNITSRHTIGQRGQLADPFLQKPAELLEALALIIGEAELSPHAFHQVKAALVEKPHLQQLRPEPTPQHLVHNNIPIYSTHQQRTVAKTRCRSQLSERLGLRTLIPFFSRLNILTQAVRLGSAQSDLDIELGELRRRPGHQAIADERH
ncbi:hypothetical protein ACEPW0_11755, partial [Pseudomonas aeruginosa]